MTVNDRWVYHHCVFQIDWYENYIKEDLEKEENEYLKETMIRWAEGKLDAYKDMLNYIEKAREEEAEQIMKEMKKHEDNEQVQSA